MSFILVAILCIGIGCVIGSIFAAGTANDKSEPFIFGMDDDFNSTRPFQPVGVDRIRR